MSTYDNAPVFETGALPLSPSDCDEHAIPTLTSARPTSKIIAFYHGSGHPLIAMLRAGEDDATTLAPAKQVVEAMPSLHRRALAQLAAVTWRSRGRAR
jgi:hypothetical protein